VIVAFLMAQVGVADDRYFVAMPIDSDPPSDDPLRAEAFDALVRVMLAEVKRVRPNLSAVESLRVAARLAEARMRDSGRLEWVVPRL
jgi:hypothetical protein